MQIKSICGLVTLLMITGFVQAQDNIYPVAQEMPTIEGCAGISDMQERHVCGQEKIKAFITENLKYPSEALKAGKDGYVMVTFVVTDKGSVTDIAVKEDPGYGMGDAAIKVVRKMSKMWVAGKNKGEPVNVKMTVPVMFRLPESESAEQVAKAPDVYTIVDDMPRFAGCTEVGKAEARNCTFQKVTMHVLANLKYPEEARSAGVEGTVLTEFIIDEQGALTEPKIVQGIGHGCDEEALRVLQAMPPWTAGMHEGKAVKVQMQLPFRFQKGKQRQED